MEILYEETGTRTDAYRFKINQGGELGTQLSRGNNFVEIIFTNGKFERCGFPFSGAYQRQHWYILKAISDKIVELEARYAGETEGEGTK